MHDHRYDPESDPFTGIVALVLFDWVHVLERLGAPMGALCCVQRCSLSRGCMDLGSSPRRFMNNNALRVCKFAGMNQITKGNIIVVEIVVVVVW